MTFKDTPHQYGALQRHSAPKRLRVILMNPALGSGAISRGRVELAAAILGYQSAEICNLFSLPSRSTSELSHLAQDWEGWDASRPALSGILAGDDRLLLAWGVGEPSGNARKHMRAQVRWVVQTALNNGRSDCWMVGGAPRHPSRWHRYVSDKYGRTSGGSLEQRLRQTISCHPLAGMQSPLA